MCGFASSNKYSISNFERFFSSVQIRGRDGVSKGSIGQFDYCFSRLALNDLTPAGMQPIYSYCGQYCILFNGEVYNFESLKRKLEDQDIVSKTGTDTEVVVNFIARYGLLEALKFMHGAFALAIFDLAKERILLCRDRFGEKPMFYSFEGGQLSFSSCLSSFAPFSKISPANAQDFCADGYLTHGRTIYENVYSLPTNKVFDYSLKSKKLSCYDFPVDKVDFKPIELDCALRDCVQQTSQADAKIGVLLSGGVDSSLIASMVASLDTPLKCYSFDTKFHGPDELSSARKVAEVLNLEHEILDVSDVLFEDRIDEYISSMSEPNTDPSYFALYELAKLAGNEVKAVLTGDGADELFAGYRRHTLAVLVAHSLIIQILLYYLSSFFRLLPRTSIANLSLFNILYSLLTGKYDDYIAKRKSKYGGFRRIDIREILLAEQRTFLSGQVLRKSDMACIANGVEVRAPFLMPPVVSISRSYQYHELNNGFTNKMPLRRLLKRRQLDLLITKGKKGFQIDIESLLDTRLRPWASQVLENKILDSIVDQEKLILNPKTKWNLAILSAWLQKFSYQ